jgi:hypothetical protein
MNLDDASAGADAARLIWDDAPEAESIRDPRTPTFARSMIETSVAMRGRIPQIELIQLECTIWEERQVQVGS